jgi:hypothetical protein
VEQTGGLIMRALIASDRSLEATRGERN